MADPISAFGTAVAAVQVGQMAAQTASYLWKLGKAISKVDQHIATLAAETSSLSQVCHLIEQEIKGVLPPTGSGSSTQYDDNGDLWKSLNIQLEQTRITLEELESIAGANQPESQDFFQRARKHVQLEKNKGELEAIRRRLHTHTQSLEMALQMVNIKVAYLGPKIVTDELGAKIEDLQKGIQDLQIELRSPDSKGPSPSELNLIQCAKEIMSSGQTLCEESLAGDDMQGGEDAARLNRRVAEWTEGIESLRRDTAKSGQSDTNTQSHTTTTNESIPPSTTTRTTADNWGWEAEEDAEVDADFLVEIAQAALEQGEQAFEQKDWREAETLLKEALTDLRPLPSRRRSYFDAFELEYKLTVCAYHTREPTVAKEALLNFVGQDTTSDGQKSLIWDAAHLLAQLHLRESELEPARIICESTLKARAKVLGKKHDLYFESLALMAQIYILLGNAARARVLMGMIPDPRRTELRESMKIRPTPAQPAVVEYSSIDSAAVPSASGSLTSVFLGSPDIGSAANPSTDSIIASNSAERGGLGGSADAFATRTESAALPVISGADSGVSQNESAMNTNSGTHALSSASMRSDIARMITDSDMRYYQRVQEKSYLAWAFMQG